jgi:hypothetical protein
MILLTVGCTTMSPPKPATLDVEPPSARSAQLGWWYARFQIEWPKDAEPLWHMDALLASEVLAPIIEEHRGEIALWRFHRRAARDHAGHQLSFIFYADPTTAARIFDRIRADSLTAQLQRAGKVLAVTCDPTASVDRPNLEDTSDRNWSPQLQRSWPYFIMGVSELWLTLVTQVAELQASREMPATLDGQLDFYSEVDQTVQTLWYREGGHALLHHLNAIFQYEPLLVGKKQTMQF